MSLMKINHLTFTYPSGTTPVFEDLTLQLDTTWKLGLIGRNGCGKSTLFKLLRGMYPYKGEIVCNTLLTSFPLSIPDPSLLTIDVLHDCYPSAEEWQLRRELNLMEVDADDLLWRPFETLSGGEQTKALLAGLFLDDAFALIDEPTNHLDLHGRELLARYLRRKRGFILISHDRHFLDGCVDHVLALGRSETRVFSGNYSTWQENVARRQAHEETQNARLQQEIRHLSKAAERSTNWSHAVEKSKIGAADKGHVGHMAAKMMKRAKAIEARRERAIEEKRQLLKDVEHDQPLKLVPLAHHAEQLAIFENVQVRYDGRTISEPQSFTVRRGDRLFLDGPNGCGKSSLLRLLVGAPARTIWPAGSSSPMCHSTPKGSTAACMPLQHQPISTAHFSSLICTKWACHVGFSNRRCALFQKDKRKKSCSPKASANRHISMFGTNPSITLISLRVCKSSNSS